jgi:hypothetical protein
MPLENIKYPIIVSEDGQTWRFDRPGPEHEFLTIAGTENAIGRVRQQLEALKNLGIADKRVTVLEENMRHLELQKQLAKEGGI